MQPNVLVFCVDEMRADHMGCAGNEIVQTPHIDSIAARGTLFRRGYCNNPICMPARATMFTGLLPRDHGLRVNGQRLREDLPTLAGILKENGYRTHAAGKLHLTPWVPKESPPDPERFPESLEHWNEGKLTEFPVPYFGFETVDYVGGHTSYVYGPYIQWLKEQGGDPALLKPQPQDVCGKDYYRMRLPEELHYNRYIADSTIRVIEDAASDDAPPFFAWCSFPDPHAPVAPSAPYDSMYDPKQMPSPVQSDTERDALPPVYQKVWQGEIKPNGYDNSGIPDGFWQEMIALTYGMITHIDTEIGRVLAALSQTGQMENTIIVLIADHGDMMGDHGLCYKSFYTFRGCIQIPYIVAAPGMDTGQLSDSLAAQVDLLPTLLDFCSVPLPGSEWTSNNIPFERGSVQLLQLYPGTSLRPVLTDGSVSVRDMVVIENDDPTTGYRVRALVTDQYRLTVYPGSDDGELFDLYVDPDEFDNLWYRKEYASLRGELLKKLLDAYSCETPLYPIPSWNS